MNVFCFGKAHYYTQNNIGSTTLLTNKDGSDIGQFLYTPFGEMWVEEASTVDISHITRFFTNQQYDKESGLYYYNARYYDPHLGSFITPDPKMDGLNHYAYCNSNPIKYTDPTGLDTGDPWGNSNNYPSTPTNNEDDDKTTTNNETNSTNSNDDSLHLTTLFDPVYNQLNNENKPINFENPINFNPEMPRDIIDFNNNISGLPFDMPGGHKTQGFGVDFQHIFGNTLFKEHHPGIDYRGFNNLISKAYLEVLENKGGKLTLGLIGTNKIFDIIHLDSDVLSKISIGDIFFPNQIISPHPVNNNGFSTNTHIEIRGFIDDDRKLVNPETGFRPNNVNDFYTQGFDIIKGTIFKDGKVQENITYQQKWHETFK